MKRQKRTVDERVISFLTGCRSLPFCVECICEEARLTLREAKVAVSGLNGFQGLEKRTGRCVRCLRPRKIICAIPSVTACADGREPISRRPEDGE